MIFLREGKLGYFHILVKMVSAHTLVKMVNVLRMKKDQRVAMLYSENKPILPNWLNCMIFVLSTPKANLQCSKIYGIDSKQKSSNKMKPQYWAQLGQTHCLCSWTDLSSLSSVDTLPHTVTHTHANWQLELKEHLKSQRRTLQKKIPLLVARWWFCGYLPDVKFERNYRAGTGVCFPKSFHWHLWRVRKHYMALAGWVWKENTFLR